jgi:hypothetical protein
MSKIVAPEADLAVVNFRSKHLSPPIEMWRSAHVVAVAESCARQVWFGRKSDFDSFPETKKEGVELRTGEKAYAYLLRIITGQDSERKNETNIAGQFTQHWEAFQAAYPEKAAAMDTTIQHLKADSRLIRNYVLNDMKEPQPMLVARDLSGLQKGERVMVVPHIGGNGSMPDHMDRLLRVLDHRKRQVGALTVSAPCPRMRDSFMAHVQTMQRDGLVHYPVMAEPFDQLPDGVEEVEHVFVDMPMGQDEAADYYVRESWRAQAHDGGSLIHLRGCPAEKGKSNALWANADLPNYISPEEIGAETSSRAVDAKNKQALAEKAIEFCAAQRTAGGYLSAKVLNGYLSTVASDQGKCPGVNPQPR